MLISKKHLQSEMKVLAMHILIFIQTEKNVEAETKDA